MEDRQFYEAMDLIVATLKERGYNPHAQLYGYIAENELTYITSHNGARALIQTLDFEKVKQYVRDMKR